MCPPRSFFLFLAFYPRRRCPLPSAFLISSFPLSLSLRRINIPPPCDAPLPSLISIYEQTYASFSQLVCAILMETPLPFLTSNVSFEEFSNGEKSYHSRRNHHRSNTSFYLFTETGWKAIRNTGTLSCCLCASSSNG